MQTFPRTSFSRRSTRGYPRRVIIDSGLAVMTLGNGVLRTRDRLGQDVVAIEDRLDQLTDADKTIWDAFRLANRAAVFYWTDPISAVTETVRFDPATPPVLVPDGKRHARWSLSYRLLPTLPSSIAVGDTSQQYDGGDAMITWENLAAGADIATRPVLPVSAACVIVAAHVLTEGAPAGVDDSNTVVLTLKDDSGNTLLTRTWNAANQPPSSDVEDLTSYLDDDYTTLAAGDHLTLSITCGTTANLPAGRLTLERNYL